MEAVLIDDWLEGRDALPILDEASVSLARQRAREVATDQGLGADDAARLATIVSELGHNVLRHALGGRIEVRPIVRGGHAGVEIIAVDRGGGIEDPQRALAGVARSSESLGAGLATVCRMADEVDFDIRLGEGSRVTARKLGPGAVRHRQLGVYGRPIGGESRNGDHAGVHRDEDVVVVAICDGLGHGSKAREASVAIIEEFHRRWREPPVDILEACHVAARGTRGAVMAIARVEEASGHVEIASVGNVVCDFVLPRETKRVEGSAFVLGPPQRPLKSVRVERTLRPGETLLMYTDGITSRAAIDEELALLRQHPIVVAYEVVRRFARAHDDVLVAVVR